MATLRKYSAMTVTSSHQQSAKPQFCTYLSLPLPLPTRSRASFSDAKISRWFAALLALATTLYAHTGVAAFECNDESWEGTSEFLAVARAVAGTSRVRLIAELDYGALTPNDAVIFLHPNVLLDELSLSAFVQQGGRAAVLDDFGKSSSFAERFGVMRLQAPTDPQESLRGNVHLPVGTPVEVQAADGSTQRHPLVRDVERVVLNHPSALTNPGLTPVLEVRTKSGAKLPVAITGVVGAANSGRLLLVSDPSAVINLMIRYPGNLAFARSMVRYLAEDDGRSGKGQLYIVANRFSQTGRFSKTQGPIPDFVEMLERVFRDLQGGMPPPLLIALTTLAALAIARWSAGHLWRQPPQTLPRSLRPVPAAAQAGWPGRAAVLVAPTTHGALLLVELREAFRARLAQLIAMEVTASSHAFVAAIENRRLLPPELLDSLRNLFADIDAAERAVVARKPIRISKAKTARLLRQSLDILEHLSQLERHHRESSPPSQ